MLNMSSNKPVKKTPAAPTPLRSRIALRKTSGSVPSLDVVGHSVSVVPKLSRIPGTGSMAHLTSASNSTATTTITSNLTTVGSNPRQILSRTSTPDIVSSTSSSPCFDQPEHQLAPQGIQLTSDHVGQLVCIGGAQLGILRYFGETQFQQGIWCGIECDTAVGKNDGSVLGIRYFNCREKFGIFAPLSKVSLVVHGQSSHGSPMSIRTDEINTSGGDISSTGGRVNPLNSTLPHPTLQRQQSYTITSTSSDLVSEGGSAGSPSKGSKRPKNDEHCKRMNYVSAMLSQQDQKRRRLDPGQRPWSASSAVKYQKTLAGHFGVKLPNFSQVNLRDEIEGSVAGGSSGNLLDSPTSAHFDNFSSRKNLHTSTPKLDKEDEEYEEDDAFDLEIRGGCHQSSIFQRDDQGGKDSQGEEHQGSNYAVSPAGSSNDERPKRPNSLGLITTGFSSEDSSEQGIFGVSTPELISGDGASLALSMPDSCCSSPEALDNESSLGLLTPSQLQDCWNSNANDDELYQHLRSPSVDDLEDFEDEDKTVDQDLSDKVQQLANIASTTTSVPSQGHEKGLLKDGEEERQQGQGLRLSELNINTRLGHGNESGPGSGSGHHLALSLRESGSGSGSGYCGSDPMTDSDFNTESEADLADHDYEPGSGIQAVVANLSKHRNARVIDGALYTSHNLTSSSSSSNGGSHNNTHHHNNQYQNHPHQQLHSNILRSECMLMSSSTGSKIDSMISSVITVSASSASASASEMESSGFYSDASASERNLSGGSIASEESGSSSSIRYSRGMRHLSKSSSDCDDPHGMNLSTAGLQPLALDDDDGSDEHNLSAENLCFPDTSGFNTSANTTVIARSSKRPTDDTLMEDNDPNGSSIIVPVEDDGTSVNNKQMVASGGSTTSSFSNGTTSPNNSLALNATSTTESDLAISRSRTSNKNNCNKDAVLVHNSVPSGSKSKGDSCQVISEEEGGTRRRSSTFTLKPHSLDLNSGNNRQSQACAISPNNNSFSRNRESNRNNNNTLSISGDCDVTLINSPAGGSLPPPIMSPVVPQGEFGGGKTSILSKNKKTNQLRMTSGRSLSVNCIASLTNNVAIKDNNMVSGNEIKDPVGLGAPSCNTRLSKSKRIAAAGEAHGTVVVVGTPMTGPKSRGRVDSTESNHKTSPLGSMKTRSATAGRNNNTENTNTRVGPNGSSVAESSFASSRSGRGSIKDRSLNSTISPGSGLTVGRSTAGGSGHVGGYHGGSTRSLASVGLPGGGAGSTGSRSPAPVKKINKWDAVMSKINETKHKQINVKDVKSKVFNSLKSTQGGSGPVGGKAAPLKAMKGKSGSRVTLVDPNQHLQDDENHQGVIVPPAHSSRVHPFSSRSSTSSDYSTDEHPHQRAPPPSKHRVKKDGALISRRQVSDLSSASEYSHPPCTSGDQSKSATNSTTTTMTNSSGGSGAGGGKRGHRLNLNHNNNNNNNNNMTNNVTKGVTPAPKEKVKGSSTNSSAGGTNTGPNSLKINRKANEPAAKGSTKSSSVLSSTSGTTTSRNGPVTKAHPATKPLRDRNRAAPSGKNGHSTEVVVQGQGQPHRRTSVSSTSTEKPSCEKSSAVPAAEVFIETSNLTNNNATITNNIVNNNNNNQQSSNGGRRTSSSTTVNAAVQENSALKEEMCRMSKVISTLEEQMKRTSHDEHQQRSKWLSKISKVEKQTEALCVVAQYCDLQRETLEKKVIQNEEAAKITSQYLQEKEQEVESLRTELVREREYHKEELAEVVKNHQSQMDCLVKEQQTQICGLKKSNEEAILDKKKYAEEIERLKEAHRLELEQTSQRHRELLEEHRKQSPHDLLLREVESLEAVVEMRNEEIHKLRKDLIEYQRTIEDLQVTREHVRTLQAKVEDLEAQLEKGRNDKAKLREKYRELEMNLNHMEAKNSRLTRLNEELKYRMQTHGMMSSSLLGNDSFSSGNSREEHEDDQDDLDNTLGRGGQGTPARIADLVKD